MNYNDVLNGSNLSYCIKHFVNEVEITGTLFSLNVLLMTLQNVCNSSKKKDAKHVVIAWDDRMHF